MPAISEAVKYGQDNSIDLVPTLSAEELYAVEQRIKALDKLLSDKGRAKFKLEVMFEHRHSLQKPTFGVLSFWSNGAMLHGGGDSKLYMCPGKALKRNACDAFIPEASAGYGHLVCPKCTQVWKSDDVIGEVGMRLTTQTWAAVLVQYFVRLENNADIYAKYPKQDIRAAARSEQEKQQMGERLTKARGSLQKVIYPLLHIVRDTMNGADLQRQFHAFLKA